MIIDQLNQSPRQQLFRILRALKEHHHTLVMPGESNTWQDLVHDAQRNKQQIIESSKFNTYMSQPTYVKCSLILEADAIWQRMQAHYKGSIMKEAEEAKPDFLDFDKDGNEKESMRKAIKDKEKKHNHRKLKEFAETIPSDEAFEKIKKSGGQNVRTTSDAILFVSKKGTHKLPHHDSPDGHRHVKVKDLNNALSSLGAPLMEDANLDKAQTLLAAKDITDRLQKMAEDAAKMAVDDLMPLVDTMKDQFGLEQATAFNNVVKQQLQTVLDSIIAAKDQTDNAINTMETGGMPSAPSDIGQPLPPMGGAPAEAPPAPAMEPGEEAGAAPAPEGEIDYEKAFAAMPATSGPEEEPLGREKKEPMSEAEQSAVQALQDMATTRKDPKGKPLTPAQVKVAQDAALKMTNAKLAEAKKAMQPGAVATAQVKKMGSKYWTGEHLTKAGIRKRDTIIRSIEKDLKESEIKSLTAQARSLQTQFHELAEQYQAHKQANNMNWLAEQADLTSAVMLENMKKIKTEMAQVLEHRRDIKQELAEQAAFESQTAQKIAMLEHQLVKSPYGVKVTRTDGKSLRKFFENADLRQTWISYNASTLTECEMIDPAHVHAVMDRLRNLI